MSFNEGIMLREMETNIYQILSYMNSAINLYKLVKYTNYSFAKILEQTNWQLSRNLSFTIVYIKNEFLDLAYVKLVELYMEESKNYIDNSKNWTLIRVVCFIIALILTYIFLLMRFMNNLTNEIWQTKGLLNLIPIKFLIKEIGRAHV